MHNTACVGVRRLLTGDRKHDIIGASQNGVSGIGVLWGYGTKEELAEAGAMALEEEPNELTGMF